MKKGRPKIVGIVSIILGFALLLDSFGGITGLAILEDVGRTTGSIIGIVLVISGTLLLMARKGKSKLEEISDAEIELETTSGFNKDIRGYNLNQINNAIKKIGTGLGGEKKLATGEYEVRTSKGGRIVFGYNPNHTTATLEAYDESHDHRKMLRK